MLFLSHQRATKITSAETGVKRAGFRPTPDSGAIETAVSGRLRFVDFEVSNTGNGLAVNVAMAVVPLPLLGSGQIGAQPNPVAIGNLAPAQSRVVRVVLTVPTTVRAILLIDVGAYANVLGTVRAFATSQTISP